MSAGRLGVAAICLAVLAAAAGTLRVALDNEAHWIAGSPAVPWANDRVVHGAAEDPVLRQGLPSRSTREAPALERTSESPGLASYQPPPPAIPPPDTPQQGDWPANQRLGTIRLPRGGTATLARSELGADGSLPIPNGVTQAAWWGSALDATTGATVLAGHVNWKGVTGPFAELWSARPGEEITVVEVDGRGWRYRVSDVLTLSKDELPNRAGELFAQRGPHRLVLVTCGGTWVGGDIGYDKNRIVIAQPVG